MLVEEVRERVNHVVEAYAGRNPEALEKARILIYRRVLRAIAAGECPDPAGCAAEAMRLDEVDRPFCDH